LVLLVFAGPVDATTYYVNDGSTVNDVYTTSVGSSTQDGLTPATPKDTVQGIISGYDLEPGDIIYVDTGYYSTSSNIAFQSSDTGSSSAPIRLIGSTHADGTTIDRNYTGYYTSSAIALSSDYVIVENVRVTEGYYGFLIAGKGNEAINCRMFGNRYGASVREDNKLTNCESYGNILYGVYVSSSGSTHEARVTGCHVHGNSSHGIYCSPSSGGLSTLKNNLVVGNGDYGIYLKGTPAAIVNNTLAANSDGAVSFEPTSGTPANLTFKNNVLDVAGSGLYCFKSTVVLTGAAMDYNLCYVTAGAKVGKVSSTELATLADWQNTTGLDAHSLDDAPRFVDRAGGDYHLSSIEGSWHGGSWAADAAHSPAIDAGDPSVPVADETQPNGGIINLGAYGGTVQASRSFTGRLLTLLTPAGGERWPSGTHEISWEIIGGGWQLVDTLTIEYSDDAGSSWTTLESAVIAGDGAYSWDIDGLATSEQYRIRLTCNADGGVSAESGDFQVGAWAYYVNDGSTINDVYTTAAGSSGNDGRSPATPKSNLADILSVYDLDPGDKVYVDTGTYVLSANIVVGGDDGGSATDPVMLIGSHHSDGSILDRNNTSSNSSFALSITGGHVAAMFLRAKRAYRGFSVTGGGSQLVQCESFGNSRGVFASGNTRIEDCFCHDNSWYGIECNSSSTPGPVIAGNVVADTVLHGIRANVMTNGSAVIHNNLITGSGVDGLDIQLTQNDELVVTNNTIVQNDHRGVYYFLNGSTAAGQRFVFKNNIVAVNDPGSFCVEVSDDFLGEFDYNNYWTGDGAAVGYLDGGTLLEIGEWRRATSQDGHSFSKNPLFVDADGGDFHLSSTGGSWHGGAFTADGESSPSIDAGDPADDVGGESVPNGGRINQGAYGGTLQASRSPVERVLTLLSPAANDRWISGVHDVVWSRTGQAWSGAETLDIEYSRDAGATWDVLAADVPAVAEEYEWDVSGYAGSPLYRIRITCDEDATVGDTSGSFRVGSNLVFYVNDGETAGDVYTTAIGSAAGHGITPASPMGSIEQVLETYDLDAGDTVYVDTGTYPLAETLSLNASDEGDETNYVRIIGSTVEGGTVLDRQSGETNAIGVDINASHVWLEGLTITGAAQGDGVRLYDTQNRSWATNVVIAGCRFVGNRYGVNCDWGPDSLILRNNLFLNNNVAAVYGYSVGGDSATQFVGNTVIADAQGIWGGLRNTYHCRNNIFRIRGKGHYSYYIDAGTLATSDYNNHWPTDGAGVALTDDVRYQNLASWRRVSNMDGNSISKDPLFADAPNGDYHLSSTGGSWHGSAFVPDNVSSPCIDAGDPAGAYGAEPAPNGGRVNLGAYGNTARASMSPPERHVVLRGPIGREVWPLDDRSIRWYVLGTSWGPADTVTVEYAESPGGPWTAIASNVLATEGGCIWPAAGLPAGATYQVRVTCDQDPVANDVSDWLRLGSDLIFYVNDASMTGDVYTTAPGNGGNSGTAPDAPMDSLQALLDRHDLEGGDVVYIDTGNYLLTHDVWIEVNDEGSVDSPVRFVGSLEGGGSVLDRNSTVDGENCMRVDGRYVHLEKLAFQGASSGDGVRLYDGHIHGWATDGRILQCRFELNRNGVNISGGVAGATVANSLFVNNNWNGVLGASSSDEVDAWIVNNTFVLDERDTDWGYCVAPGSRQTFHCANNILWVTGANHYGYLVQDGGILATSDYNDLYAGNGAILGFFNGTTCNDLNGWQALTGKDAHSVGGDPLFVDRLAGDYRLQGGSPCIDAGDNDAVPADVSEDHKGALRFMDDPATSPDPGNAGMAGPPVVDIGAFEFVPAVPGDRDGDGDVDLADLGDLETCTSGPNMEAAPACATLDFDSDGDVDQSDFGTFQRCYSGEGNPANPNCAE